jgi:hypothetical protein
LDEEGKKCYSNLMKNLNDSLKWDFKNSKNRNLSNLIEKMEY